MAANKRGQYTHSKADKDPLSLLLPRSGNKIQLPLQVMGAKNALSSPCAHRGAKIGSQYASVAIPYKNVPPRAAHLNICPKGANISHARSAYFTAAKRRFHTAAKLAAYHFGSQNNYSQRFAAVFHCGGTAAYSPSIISFRVARFLSKSKSSTAMPRTFAFSHVPSTGMCAGSISHSRIIGSSFTA